MKVKRTRPKQIQGMKRRRSRRREEKPTLGTVLAL